MRVLNMVTNGKVDDVTKPTESKRSGSAIISSCRCPTAKLFKDMAWGIGCKWTPKED